jgi:hypothetical protein
MKEKAEGNRGTRAGEGSDRVRSESAPGLRAQPAAPATGGRVIEQKEKVAGARNQPEAPPDDKISALTVVARILVFMIILPLMVLYVVRLFIH